MGGYAVEALVMQAQTAGTPIISCMGAGNKLNAPAFEVADIYETSVCPPGTARKCTQRRQLPGSNAYVPAVAGLICAGEVINDIALSRV